MLNSFIKLVAQIDKTYSEKCLRFQVTESAESENPSVRLDIDMPAAIGRVTYWQNGDFHAEVLSFDSGDTIYADKADALEDENIYRRLSSFLYAVGLGEI